MDAAEMLFRSQQLHEITVDDVLRRAGVGKGTVYRHFADKDDLFFQTALRGFEDMCQALKAIQHEGVPFRDAILQACRTIREFFLKRRPLFLMILTEDDLTRIQGGGLRQRWLRHRKKMTEALGEIIGMGVATGQVRPAVPPAVLTEYLLGMLRTCANELSEADEQWRSDKSVVDMFLRGASGPDKQDKK
jgi:AcrR family transcriptional regulator